MHATPPAGPPLLATETIARAVVPRATHLSESVAPTSELTREQAMVLAQIYSALNGKDIVVCDVAATGSMRPYFDENALLLMEAVPFSELRLGDVVTFRHPRLGTDVVHRLVEKRGNAFWTKGDHNDSMDDIYVTAANFHRRLVGVIYFQPGSGDRAGALAASAIPPTAQSPRRPRKSG
jgi:hypothetical protein